MLFRSRQLLMILKMDHVGDVDTIFEFIGPYSFALGHLEIVNTDSHVSVIMEILARMI